MKIGINQPYLFPYKGYFKLIQAVDKFVIFDDAQYITRGWIHRNYFPDKLFTFRLKKHSSRAPINECYFFDIEDDKKRFKEKTGINADRYLNLMKPHLNIAINIAYTLRAICDDLGISTPFYFASDIPHGKAAQALVDITKALGGDTYINLPGGKGLYSQEQFGDIKLEFIETTPEPSILCSEEIRKLL